MPAGRTYTVCPQATRLHLPAGQTSTACPQFKLSQCARRPHIYTCPQAIHLLLARRPYICTMPTGHINSTPAGRALTVCPLAIHIQHARWPYIHSMPAGQYTCNMPAGHILQYAQYILQQTGLASNSRPQAITTRYHLATRLTTTCPPAYLLNLPAGPTLSTCCRLNTYFSKLDH